MATAARTEVEEIPLIEEQVDTGLQQMLDGYRTHYVPGGEKKDELNKRFVLYGSKPLPEFDHAYAKAYQAEDMHDHGRPVYAMVCDNTLPYRQHAIQVLNGYNHPNMVNVLGAGTVACSHLGESRMVLFLERPQGNRLTDLLKQGRMHEHRVLDYVLQPAVKVLMALRERHIGHGHINPNNFFVSDTPKLGDGFSSPCGSLNHYLYEPPERAAADPGARGEATEKSDVYALGVLAYELIYGLDKLKALTYEEFTKLTLELSTYHVFANNREFSDMYQDFFRGVLSDNPNERWGLEQLQQWLAGKRFNMIAPQAPKEASRALTFMGQNHFSRRTLANALHQNWAEAVKEVKGLRLDRWFEMSLHNPEMGERLERILRIAGDASTERHVSDMMTRTLAVLDPTGPIRNMNVTVRPDGIGPELAALVQAGPSPELTQLLTVIETDVSNFWSELDPYNKSHEQSQVLWRLQRVRPYLKSKAFGFGLERVLYELNPSLPCQSDLLKQFHITSASEALRALDALAHNLAPETSFIDRHLAAFVACKVDIGKEVRLNDLSNTPALADNPELVVMRILAKAQQKQERLQLVGLATWAAMRLEKMLDEIHNRINRRHLKLQLKKLAATGSLSEVLNAVVNRDIATRDHTGFAQAIALHQINQAKIERFQNQDRIRQKAKNMGGRMASSIAYLVMTVTGFIVLTKLLGA